MKLIHPQRANYKRNFKIGSLPPIPRRTIILHARLTTREQHPGFSKAVYSKSGSGLLLSCGSTANVRSFPFQLLSRPSDSRLLAGSDKSVLWFVVFYCCCLHGLKFPPSSGIIEDIIAEREAGLAIMTYFYCDFRDEDKQNCRSLVLSIISQLCAQSDIYFDTLSRIYLAHDKGARIPSDETLTRFLTRSRTSSLGVGKPDSLGHSSTASTMM